MSIFRFLLTPAWLLGIVVVVAGCASAALIEAAAKNDLEQANTILQGQGDVDLNYQNPKGATALMLASYFGHRELAELLLDKGADPNAADNNGWTPLIYAVWNRRAGVIPLLLARGADSNVEVFSGKTVLEFAEERNLKEIAALLSE